LEKRAKAICRRIECAKLEPKKSERRELRNGWSKRKLRRLGRRGAGHQLRKANTNDDLQQEERKEEQQSGHQTNKNGSQQHLSFRRPKTREKTQETRLLSAAGKK